MVGLSRAKCHIYVPIVFGVTNSLIHYCYLFCIVQLHSFSLPVRPYYLS